MVTNWWGVVSLLNAAYGIGWMKGASNERQQYRDGERLRTKREYREC